MSAFFDLSDDAVALPGRYSPEAISRACSRAPFYVIARCTVVFLRCTDWVVSALARGQEAAEDPELAVSLRKLLVDLGPSFVKLGQMLASRSDICPPVYVAELRQLADSVEPFSREEAQMSLRSEWQALGLGAPLVDTELPEHPVAAASLSQVYRLELDGFGAVALKIQRPGVRSQVCVDLFIFRQIASVVAGWVEGAQDVLALVDEYASRLVDELDFTFEARNALEFQESARRLDLEAICTVARPIVMLTSRSVLATTWLEGEKLDDLARRDPEEAKRMQSVALTAYLSMLLETGSLHADPHVGNLLRATDGRLAILDWGLVTRISPTMRGALLTYIAHVLARDYKAIPADLVALGFISADMQDMIDEADVAEGIGDVFRQMASGGAITRRVADILPILSAVREKHGRVAHVPAIFFYILRTFSILEGSGLRLDEGYKIVDDCFPYLASWATRARGPEARRLLKTVLYGARGHAVPDAAQILTLCRGLAAHIRQAAAWRHGMSASEADEAAAAQAVLFEEAARAADVLLREGLETAAWAAGMPAAAAAVPPRTEADRALLSALAEIANVVSETAAEASKAASQSLLTEVLHVLGLHDAEGDPVHGAHEGGEVLRDAARVTEVLLRRTVETAAWAAGDSVVAGAAAAASRPPPRPAPPQASPESLNLLTNALRTTLFGAEAPSVADLAAPSSPPAPRAAKDRLQAITVELSGALFGSGYDDPPRSPPPRDGAGVDEMLLAASLLTD